ncbi:MAG: phospholipase [Planctomycetota bacterium]
MNDTKQIGELTCTIVNHQESPKGAAVFCHGFGAPGTDLVGIGSELIRMDATLKEMVFVFPQAPIELDPYFDARAWWMIDIEKIQALMAKGEFREMRNSNPPELIERSRQISKIIDELLTSYKLEPEQLVVGGFSQGSMLTTDVALNYPQPLGGLVVWSGALICEDLWTTAAKRQTKLNIVQSHGTIDPILPFAGAEFLRDLLEESGHDVKFIPFQGPHTIGVDALEAAKELLLNAVEP